MVRLSQTVGFCVSSHAHRSHPASLSVRVPTVVSLLQASFSLASRRPPCLSLRLLSVFPIISFHMISSCPCRAHEGGASSPPKEWLNCYPPIQMQYASVELVIQHSHFDPTSLPDRFDWLQLQQLPQTLGSILQILGQAPFWVAEFEGVEGSLHFTLDTFSGFRFDDTADQIDIH